MCTDNKMKKRLVRRTATLAVEAYAMYEGNSLTTIALRKHGETSLQVMDVHRNSVTKGRRIRNWKWKGFTDIKRQCRVPMSTHVQIIDCGR